MTSDLFDFALRQRAFSVFVPTIFSWPFFLQIKSLISYLASEGGKHGVVDLHAYKTYGEISWDPCWAAAQRTDS
jgi:hypothetical protein